MAKGHSLGGLLAGVGFVALIPSAPLPVRGLLVVVTGGAALLPDLDHPAATAARSLGLFTKLIAIGVDRVAVAVYHATRAPGDRAGRHGGHRLLTHTVPWNVSLGGLVAVLGMVSPVASAVVCGLLAGLLGLGLRVAGVGLAVSSAVVAWWLLNQHPAWSWGVAVAVSLGGLVHLVCDAVTPSGVPLLWPLVSRGERWRMVHTPVTFDAGGAEETFLVTPLMLLGLVATVSWVTGLLPVVVAAVSRGGA
ncbi:MAG: rane protein [Streptosporangiaceae bacterium]|nr:rane protein [Streptosporangiaceae bacterium]